MSTSTILTNDQAATKLPSLFMETNKLYSQTGKNATIYISKKTVLGVHPAVLPIRQNNAFSVYSVGNDEDIIKLQELSRYKGIFKTYCCSLCPIDQEDNAVHISREQNQFYIDESKSPINIVSQKFLGISNMPYIITATTPQYYYNHLMIVSENHIPTYSLYTLDYLFIDIMRFLEAAGDGLIAYHNGNFGSDVDHFHVHLTKQNNYTLDQAIIQSTVEVGSTGGKIVYKSPGGIVECVVYSDKNINSLFFNMTTDVFLMKQKMWETPNMILSSSLSVRKLADVSIYYVVLNITDSDYNRWDYNGCSHYIFPAAYVLTMDCSVIPVSRDDIIKFKNALLTHYRNYFVTPDKLGISFTRYVVDMRSYSNDLTSYYDIIRAKTEKNEFDIPIEYLYAYLYDSPLDPAGGLAVAAANGILLLEYVLTMNCLDFGIVNCSRIDMGSFKYFLGLGVNSVELSILKESDEFRKLRLNNEYYLLNLYNPTTKYLWFRGKFIQDVLVKTINNLLRITSTTSNTRSIELQTVNEWLDYNYMRIGEASAVGAITIEKMIQFPDIKFAMKIMSIESNYHFNMWVREFFVSHSVNDIRALVPNFLLCFGGYQCSNSITVSSTGQREYLSLCDSKGPPNTGYILLEEIEGKTVARVLRTPSLKTQETYDDTLNIILQVVAGLSFGYQVNKFTHYDLHTDNVMQYDFINNPSYLSLFSNYNTNNSIPDVEKIIFKYYTHTTDPTKFILIPAKYLYILIDYGTSYTESSEGNPPVDPAYQAGGMTSNISNPYTDCFTFLMWFYHEIFRNKPFLLIDTMETPWSWRSNKLIKVLDMFLESYSDLWAVSVGVLKDRIILTLNTENRDIRRMFYDSVKLAYKPPDIGWWAFVNPTFPTSQIKAPMRNSWELLIWLINNCTDQTALLRDTQSKTTYTFNWGHIPKGTMDGIEPNYEIKELIQDEKNKQIAKSRAIAQLSRNSDFVDNITP